MKIWICIPVFNRKELTIKCLASLQKQTYTNFNIVICDHGSTDGTTEAIHEQYPNIIVINGDSSLWWTGAINLCVSHVLKNAAPDDALLTMNNDNEVLQDYLQNLVTHFLKYPKSIITSVVHDIKTNQLISPGFRQNWLLANAKAINFDKNHLPNNFNLAEVTHASGRGTLFPLNVYKIIGLYDEKHLPHYGADDDLSFKAARAGFKIYIGKNCPVLSHIEETGMTQVLTNFSIKSFLNYLTSIRSPASLNVRFWYGWNNCPKLLFPSYILLDFIRILGSYVKNFIHVKI